MRSEPNTLPPNDCAGADKIKLFCFKIGDDEYGIPFTCVRGVLQTNKIMLKQCEERGTIAVADFSIGALDLRDRFGVAPSRTLLNDPVIIIVNILETLTGLVVDSITGSLSLHAKQIEAPPPTISNCGKFVKGIAKLNQGSRIIIIIKLESFIK